jgi:predicted membrane protein
MEAAFVPSLVRVLVAAAATFMLGGLWYGPLFGKAWQRRVGLTHEQLKSANMARTFGVSFVLSFVAAWVFAMFLGSEPDPAFAVGVGALAGLCWVGASFGINDLFEQRSFGLWAINAGYHTVAFTLYGVVFGLWH